MTNYLATHLYALQRKREEIRSRLERQRPHSQRKAVLQAELRDITAEVMRLELTS